jgi:hypothetical protein
MTTKPTLGDKQSCVICGQEAEFKRLSVPDAYTVGDGGALPEPVPDSYGWECSVCGHQTPAESH